MRGPAGASCKAAGQVLRADPGPSGPLADGEARPARAGPGGGEPTLAHRALAPTGRGFAFGRHRSSAVRACGNTKAIISESLVLSVSAATGADSIMRVNAQGTARAAARNPVGRQAAAHDESARRPASRGRDRSETVLGAAWQRSQQSYVPGAIPR